jgi:hypothetical protein
MGSLEDIKNELKELQQRYADALTTIPMPEMWAGTI